MSEQKKEFKYQCHVCGCEFDSPLICPPIASCPSCASVCPVDDIGNFFSKESWNSDDIIGGLSLFTDAQLQNELSRRNKQRLKNEKSN